MWTLQGEWWSERRARLAATVAAVCLLALFAGLGSTPLWEPDEPRFAESTRQMVLNGDHLTPRFNGQPRFEKPILFYWLQLPFFAALGPTELAARLPSALAAVGCVALTFLIGVRLFDEAAAWVGALALATLFRFVTYARQGLTDVPAMFFELLALFGFLLASRGATSRLPILAAWAAVGLAAATKGPVAVIPVAVWLCFLLATRDAAGLRRLRVPLGVPIVLALALPWYGYMIAVHGSAFFDIAFDREIAGRITAADVARRGLLYYFNVWPADMIPWTPTFVAAVAYAAAARTRLDPDSGRGALLLMIWFVVVLVLFSAAGGKLPHYLLPAYPAAALMCGLLVSRARSDALALKLWWVAVAVTILALALSGALVSVFLVRSGVATAAPFTLALPVLLLLAPVAVLFVARQRGTLAAAVAMSLGMAASYAVTAGQVLPRVDGLHPLASLARSLAPTLEPDDRVGYLGGYNAPGLVFYSRHTVDVLRSPAEVAAYLAAPGRAFCVLSRRDADAAMALAPGAIRPIGSARKLVVRFNRVFGTASLYDDGLVLLGNDSASPER